MCTLIAPQLWRREFCLKVPEFFLPPIPSSWCRWSESRSLCGFGNSHLAQQDTQIIDLSVSQEGRLKPWGRRGFCKMVKMSARLGVFLFFPRCPHELLPHKDWFSLAALSHTDDLALLGPGVFVHWQAEEGRPQTAEFLVSSCYSEKWGGDLIHPLEETLEGDESCKGCLLFLADTGDPDKFRFFHPGLLKAQGDHQSPPEQNQSSLFVHLWGQKTGLPYLSLIIYEISSII